MGLFRGIAARKDATRGTSPIEVRKVLAGLFASTGGIGARSGILYNGSTAALVTGNATWAYNVGIFHAFVSRSNSDGGQVYGNDGAVLIGTTGVGSTVPVAPGSGLSRIDIAWTRHPTNTENADTASEPLFGVASGTAASSSPVAPTIPAGALELGRNLMTSAATSTLSAGNTITQTSLYTALRGAPVPFRNQTERDAYPAPYDGLEGHRLDTHVTETYNGTAWVLPWVLPAKIVVSATITANGPDTYLGYDSVFLTAPSITADGTARFKVTVSYYAVLGTTAMYYVKIQDSTAGTVLGTYAVGVNLGGTFTLSVVPTAGPHVYEATLTSASGTDVAHVASPGSTWPAELLVEQIT